MSLLCGGGGAGPDEELTAEETAADNELKKLQKDAVSAASKVRARKPADCKWAPVNGSSSHFVPCRLAALCAIRPLGIYGPALGMCICD